MYLYQEINKKSVVNKEKWHIQMKKIKRHIVKSCVCDIYVYVRENEWNGSKKKKEKRGYVANQLLDVEYIDCCCFWSTFS